jgi:hypothetical protein
VTDLHEQIDDSASSDFWDVDWTTAAISAALVVGWLAWIGIIAYRLLVP